MKAVVLAAGKGMRMEPLSCGRPKPMISVANRPFLMHVFDTLDGLVDEVLVIIHKTDTKTPTLGKTYKSLSLSYVLQDEPLGTAHALLCAKEYLSEPFLVVNGDCLFPREDLAQCRSEPCILVREVPDLSRFGAVFHEAGTLRSIVEKPKAGGPGYANAGVYMLTPNIFQFYPSLSPRGEYEITDMLNAYAKQHHIRIVLAQQKHHSLSYPWDMLPLHQHLLSQLTGQHIFGDIEQPCKIIGPVIIGKGTKVNAFAVIKGPCIIGENCDIGEDACIRPYTSIGDNCRINCEVKNSLIYEGVKSGHRQSSILDSIVDEKTNIGAGTITANLRHDEQTIKSMVKDKLVDSGLRKLGAIIGHHVHTGIGTKIRPGRKLWPGTTTIENEVVTKDKHPENQIS